MEPHKENIKKWVEALESGNYSQITGALETKNGNCCLGVACRVAMENGVSMDVQVSEPGSSFNGRTCTLPSVVYGWLGIIPAQLQHDVMLKYNGILECAIDLNDKFKLSFPEIAQCIRNTYLTEE